MSTDLTELLQAEHPMAMHPDLPGVTAFFMAIGPSLADKILSGYKEDYRPYIKANGEALNRAMSNEQWVFDGSPIRFLKDGSFADGQHRMTAIKKSGKTHIFLVVMGLENEAYDSMDTGAIRDYAASLRRRGFTKNAPLMALFIQCIHRWENGLPMLSEGKVIHPELDVVLEKHREEILRCIDLTVSGSKKIKMSPSLVALCWWLFRRINVEKASIFMTQLAYGEDIHRGMPVYHLKLKLEEIREETMRTRVTSHNRHHFLCIVFQAFNAFDAGIPRTNFLKGDGTRNSVNKVDPLVDHADRMKALQRRESE